MKTRQDIVKIRQDIVYNQAILLLETIKKNKEDKLEKEILSLKFDGNKQLKSDAVRLAMEGLKPTNPEMSKWLDDIILPAAEIGGVKTRGLKNIGEKEDGVTSGNLAQKAFKPEDDLLNPKYDRDILQKKDDSIEDKLDLIFEYIGSQVANAFLPKNSPKFRLYKDVEEKVSGASTFIDDFKTLNDLSSTANAKGFGKLFAATVMLGDYDAHGDNAGVRSHNKGEEHFARIDFGRAFSYMQSNDWKNKEIKMADLEKSAFQAKDSMQYLYDKNLFKGVDFACDVFKTTNLVSERKLATILDISMKNLKTAYGEGFLQDENIKEEFKYRLGIADVTEENIKKSVIGHVKRTKNQLQDMAIEEIGRATSLTEGQIASLNEFSKEITDEGQKKKFEAAIIEGKKRTAVSSILGVVDRDYGENLLKEVNLKISDITRFLPEKLDQSTVKSLSKVLIQIKSPEEQQAFIKGIKDNKARDVVVLESFRVLDGDKDKSNKLMRYFKEANDLVRGLENYKEIILSDKSISADDQINFGKLVAKHAMDKAFSEDAQSPKEKLEKVAGALIFEITEGNEYGEYISRNYSLSNKFAEEVVKEAHIKGDENQIKAVKDLANGQKIAPEKIAQKALEGSLLLGDEKQIIKVVAEYKGLLTEEVVMSAVSNFRKEEGDFEKISQALDALRKVRDDLITKRSLEMDGDQVNAYKNQKTLETIKKQKTLKIIQGVCNERLQAFDAKYVGSPDAATASNLTTGLGKRARGE